MPDRSDSSGKRLGMASVELLFATGGILFVGIVLQLGLGFLARVLVARTLGPAGYGIVALGVTLLTTLSLVALLGTDTAVGRYLPRYDESTRRRGVLLSAYQVAVPVAVGFGALLVLLAGPIARHAFHDPAIAPVIRVLGLAVPFATFVRLTIGSVRGMQESLPRVYIEYIGLPSLRILLIAGALLFGLGEVGVAGAYLGAYVLTATLALYYLYAHTPLFESVVAESMHSRLLAFSVPVLVTQVMNVAFHNIDTLMLGYFTTASAVGVYNVVYPLANLLTVVLIAFGFLFMPTISELHAEGAPAEMRRTYHVVSKWILLLTLPLFLVLATYPRTALGIAFGSEYVHGGLALTVVAVGFFSHAVAGPTGDTLTAMGRTRTIMYDNVFVAAVNVALNLYLIPRYSFLGAAVATTVGYLLLNGLYLAQLYRSTAVHPFRPALVRPGGAGILLWIALAWGIGLLVGAETIRILAAVCLFVPLYAVVVLRFGGVEREELLLLDSLEDRVAVDLDPVRGVARRLSG